MTNREFKNWRQAHGLSQGKLAKALGVRSMTVARWEWGTIRIPALLPLALEALENRLKEERKARGRITHNRGGRGLSPRRPTMTRHRSTISSTRGWLYWMARLLGDANAIQHGPTAIEKRVERRLVGKMAGRTLWRLFK